MTLTRLLGINILMFARLSMFSQCGEYLDNKHLADSCFKLKAYSPAADYYQKCLKSSEKKRIDYYYASYCNVQINKLKKALNYLNIAGEAGLRYNKLDDFNKDTLFLKLYKSNLKWKRVGDKIKVNTIAYQNRSNTDSALVKILMARKTEDQKYRSPNISLLPLNVSDSLWQIQKATDIENKKWLSEEIKQNGWPVISKVGEEGDNAAWLIVQHADNDTTFQRNCLELLKKLMLQNETNSRNVAYLEDRLRINTNKKQLYGTQFENILKDGKTINIKLKPTEDLPCLNKKRAYMNLEPVEEYLNHARKRYMTQ